jgi:hypothetical protein
MYAEGAQDYRAILAKPGLVLEFQASEGVEVGAE